jgi:plastocyanin
MATFLRTRLGRIALYMGGAVAALSCGGDGDTGQPSTTTTIAKATVSGDQQTGSVGESLTLPLQVVVVENDAPKAGANVSWSTTGGGTVAPTSVATDAQGIASTTWTLGTTAGSQSAQATLTGADGSPVSFTANADPGSPTTLSMTSGDQQVGVINTALPNPLVAEVTDEFGNGLEGVDVEWAASNATLSATSVPTDASGTSQVTVTLGGTEGPASVTATSAGLAGSPLMFNATATAVPTVPTTATVRVGNIEFASAHNATVNPAVDTVAVGGTVTWNWVNTQGVSHSVESTGSPSFTSSAIQASGSYQFTFTTAGTYSYDCAVHGTGMTGRIVVR